MREVGARLKLIMNLISILMKDSIERRIVMYTTIRPDGTKMEIDLSCSHTVNDELGHRLVYNSGRTVWLWHGRPMPEQQPWNGKTIRVDKKGNTKEV